VMPEDQFIELFLIVIRFVRYHFVRVRRLGLFDQAGLGTKNNLAVLDERDRHRIASALPLHLISAGRQLG